MIAETIAEGSRFFSIVEHLDEALPIDLAVRDVIPPEPRLHDGLVEKRCELA